MPKSATKRSAGDWLQLLTSVDLYAPPGLQFRGQLLTPGAPFAPDQLPTHAVILECAGSVRVDERRSRYAFRHLWVLWRFDAATCQWIEVMRSLEGLHHFAPVAYKLLYAAPRGDEAETAARAIAERVIDQLRDEMRHMLREVACCFLVDVHTFIAKEIVLRSQPLLIARKPVGREIIFPRLGAHEGKESGQLTPGPRSLYY